MSHLALVTGAKDRMEELRPSLERAGWTVLAATEPAELGGVCAEAGPAAVDAYVQLPWAPDLSGRSPLQGTAIFLGAALVSRWEAMAVALPALSRTACVIVVDDEAPDGTPGDDPRARLDLLRGLARALVLEPGGGERKAMVVGADRSPEEIAALALGRGEDRRWLHTRITALSPDLDFSDWRREVLLLTGDEGV